ncbi:MAG: hypothetical protein P0121_04575 [Nitrospira sp.]|nr:hypothetical protein [Nitrospira sp.]
MRDATLDESFSRSWWKEQFHRKADHPRTWELKAAELEYAAEVLWLRQMNDFPLQLSRAKAPPASISVALMLYGLAIENLLKAIIVATGSPLDKNGRISFKMHKLSELARSAGIRVAQKDEFFLNKLTEFVEWAGRYPVPLSFQKMQPFRWPDRTFGPAHGAMTGGDIEHARTIIQRLVRRLPKPAIRVGLRRLATRSTRTRRKRRAG